MLISGFTMVRNADKLYFPIKPSIQSVLPIVDEYVAALGKGDPDDHTKEIIESINDPKVKIIDRIWDEKLFANSTIFAHETSFALNQCKGTWCLYLQGDEAIHEDHLNIIVEYCKKYKDDLRVDGFLFNYYHFWGDYEHQLERHGLCRKEIRIVRNNIGAWSYRDAISFRKGENDKLNVINIPAYIYHYGYVRPPQLMGVKKKIHDTLHQQGKDLNAEDAQDLMKTDFTYGPLGDFPIFRHTHPKVMHEWMAKLDWKDQLNMNKKKSSDPILHKHQQFKYKWLTKFEQTFCGNQEIFGWKNYILLKK